MRSQMQTGLVGQNTKPDTEDVSLLKDKDKKLDARLGINRPNRGQGNGDCKYNC